MNQETIHEQERGENVDVATALRDYFDGWYEGDPEKLKAIFHPSCHLFSVIDGKLDDDGMATVYAYVTCRPSPASKGEDRHDKILSIDRTGNEMAHAKVQISIGNKLFTDHLSMLFLGGKWRIVSKTFDHVPLNGS